MNAPKMKPQNGHVLIIDDEEAILSALSELVGAYSGQCWTATDGNVALKIMQEEEIHCVICDMNMPAINGLEIIKKARALDIQVPFIFFTNQDKRETLNELSRYGIFGLVNKPNYEELEDLVPLAIEEGERTAKSAQKNQDISAIIDLCSFKLGNEPKKVAKK